MSIAASLAGYELLFNRDELHTRAEEQPPTRGDDRGATFAAPRDGARGGTWLMLNSHGVTAALLNDYTSGGGRTGTRSRGEIPLWCTSATSAVEALRQARETLCALGSELFAPFRLVLLSPGQPALLLHWNGSVLTDSEAGAFLTSSSRDPHRIEADRTAQRGALGASPTPERLLAFHWSHALPRGAESVCMHRDDARTRSLCHVRVRSGQRPSLRYSEVVWPGPERGRTVEEIL